MEGSMHPTATALLRGDHRKVEDLYQRFQEAREADDRVDLADDIFHELEIHSRLEECLFYPGLARQPSATAPVQPLVQHLGREHGEVKRLISEFRLGENGTEHLDPGREALVARIMASVEAHVSEEEGQAFPLLEADPDRNEALGAELARLKTKLRLCPPVFRTIRLDVPVQEAYDQWTRFEDFPRFLENVREVRQLDDRHVFWRVQIAGKEFQWTAQIHEQVPEHRIAWSSTEGALNAGSVSFRALTADSCRMLVELAYEPAGIIEDLGAALGLVSRQMTIELQKFKDFLESGARTGGGWRGRIAGNPVSPELTRQGVDPGPSDADRNLGI
jgi:uncharacterized membrane protein